MIQCDFMFCLCLAVIIIHFLAIDLRCLYHWFGFLCTLISLFAANANYPHFQNGLPHNRPDVILHAISLLGIELLWLERICKRLCVYLCIYIYKTNLKMCIYIYIYVCMYVYMSVKYIVACVYLLCVYTYIHVQSYIHIYIYTYIYIHTYN